jgi:hypothetical protein
MKIKALQTSKNNPGSPANGKKKPIEPQEIRNQDQADNRAEETSAQAGL